MTKLTNKQLSAIQQFCDNPIDYGIDNKLIDSIEDDEIYNAIEDLLSAVSDLEHARMDLEMLIMNTDYDEEDEEE